MTARRLRTAFAVALLPLLAVVSVAADDSHGDAVPEGAKARLGTARMRSVNNASPNAITPDGKFLVGTTNAGIGFLDPTGKVARTVRVDGEYGTVFAFSADGKRALSGGYPSVFVWDTESGKVLTKTARNMPGGDNGVSLAADGKRFAVGGTKSFNDKDKDKLPAATVWDVDGNKQLASVTPAQNETIFVALSPDGKRLATWGYYYDRDAKESPKPDADPSRLVQFWDAATGKEVAKARLLAGGNPAVVAFSPDGGVAAVSGGDGAVHLFDPATGAEKGLLLGRSRQGRRLAFSPDGKTLASLGEDGAVQRWSWADGKRLGTTESPIPMPFNTRGLTFTDNERVVVWASRGVASVMWDAPAGKLLTPVGGHSSGITGAAVAGGGKEIFTGASDGTIIRWDPATGKELGTLSLKSPASGYGSPAVNSPVAFSADGTRALASDYSGGIAIYDLPAGSQQFVIPGDYNREGRGTLTPDGTRVVQLMSSYDAKKNPAKVAVWDVAAAKRLGAIDLPGLNQVAASLSPDGKTLVTAGVLQSEKGPGEFVVTGWDLATGKKRGEFTEAGGFGSVSVATTGDNKTAVVTSPKSGVFVLDFTTGKKVHSLDVGGKRTGLPPVVSPDGKTVAVPMGQNFGPNPTAPVLLFDVASGKLKKTLAGGSSPSVVVFSTDGRTLVTGSYDTTALVWDISE